MLTVSRGNGSINCANKFGQVEDENRQDIGDIGIGNAFRSENDGDGPPETHAVEGQQKKLGEQGLNTMPAHKIGSFEIANVKYKGSNQVNDWQWQPAHYGNQRHHVTV